MNEEPEDPESFTIPHHYEPRITHETFCKLFDDHSRYENFTIIDCRSVPEYEGGHIKGSIQWHPNEKASKVEELHKKIFKPRSIYIFHCEYSEYRGPMAWEKFRRAHVFSSNRSEPLHAFVLEGGFSKFYELHPDYCDGTYVPEKTVARPRA